MSLEIEAKYRLSDSGQALRAGLDRFNAQSRPGYIVSDTYLRHPARDFAKTGEAFRIRREADAVHLTYKGPKQPTEGVKTRQEIEIGLAATDDIQTQALAMFQAMGFTEVLTVEKFRTPFYLDFQGWPLTVVLDDARELGCFAELELVVEDASCVKAAESSIKELGQLLGLTDYEPRSYLRMWLERQKNGSREPRSK